MKQIMTLNLFIGTKEETTYAFKSGFSILSALNVAGDYPSHKTLVQYKTRWCDKNHPEYLFGRRKNWMALNMIDCDNPNFYSNEMINAGIDFIKTELYKNNKVLIHCSLGESRAPSMAFMYLLQEDLIDASNFIEAYNAFKKLYPLYNPKIGPIGYIKKRFFDDNNVE